jgi:hypothetical protein
MRTEILRVIGSVFSPMGAAMPVPVPGGAINAYWLP